MAEFPALPLWTDAYLADTAHLTNEEHGVYLRLLMFAWRTPGCSLPDDDKRLAIMVGVTPKKWQTLRPVMESFWTIENGTWTQKRLTAERDFVEGRSRAGRAGAAGRWGDKSLKRQDTVDAVASARHMPDQCEVDAPIPTPIIGDGDDTRASRTDREQILAAIGVDPVSGIIGPSGRMLGTQADMAEVARWLDLPGLTMPLILAEVRSVMARKRDGPPASFRFFSQAMQRLSGELTRPSLDPITPTNGGQHDRQRFDRAIDALAAGLSAGTVGLGLEDRDPFAQRSGRDPEAH